MECDATLVNRLKYSMDCNGLLELVGVDGSAAGMSKPRRFSMKLCGQSHLLQIYSKSLVNAFLR